jgi:hypothetical protein
MRCGTKMAATNILPIDKSVVDTLTIIWEY